MKLFYYLCTLLGFSGSCGVLFFILTSCDITYLQAVLCLIPLSVLFFGLAGLFDRPADMSEGDILIKRSKYLHSCRKG